MHQPASRLGLFLAVGTKIDVAGSISNCSSDRTATSATSPPEPTRRWKSAVICGGRRAFKFQFQNFQIFKWRFQFRPQLDKHTCPSRKGLHCECTWHQLGIPKSSSSGRSSHPHSAVGRWFRKGHLLGIHSRNSEYTPGLSQPPAGCFKVQPRRWQLNQQKLETAEQQGAAKSAVLWVRPIKSGISVPDSSLSRRAVSSLNPCILELKLLKSVG